MARLDVPSLEEVGAAFGRVAERAKARFRGEIAVPYEENRKEDEGTIERWAEAGAWTSTSRRRGQSRSSAE